MRNRILLAILLVSAASAAGQQSNNGVDKPPLKSGQIDLWPKFREGQVVRYRVHSLMTHRPGGEAVEIIGSNPITLEFESGQKLAVVKVDESTASLEWTLEYIQLKSSGAIPGIAELLDYDSREPEGSRSPLASLFGPLVNQPVGFRCDVTGKVLDMQPVAAGGNDLMGQLLGGFFSTSMLEQMPFFATSSAPRPAKKISKWQKMATIQMPLGVGGLQLDSTYQMKAFKKKSGLATIEINGVISQLPAPAGGNNGFGGLLPMDALQLSSSSFSGELLWDTELGFLEHAQSNLQVRYTCETALGRMDIDQELNTTVERREAFVEKRSATTQPAAPDTQPAEPSAPPPAEPPATQPDEDNPPRSPDDF
ncbi:MAG: hypothetical protein HJJLKODD_02944 [Phycisphaerae bacterium]|nr:hypothetical protein [Phycisphaerae bacterium]